MKLKVLLVPEKVGGYSVSVPALPGCHSEGDTLREALANIREAASLWLEVADKRAASRHKSRRKGAALQVIEL
jgi:predicted RNase H-like HicB family nuclease